MKRTDENSEILHAATELIVTLRSWGLHQNGQLMTRDADTGKLVGGWVGDRLEALIMQAMTK